MYIYIYIYIHIHLYTNIYIYICIYVYTHIPTHMVLGFLVVSYRTWGACAIAPPHPPAVILSQGNLKMPFAGSMSQGQGPRFQI